jgi:hypothetical protein
MEASAEQPQMVSPQFLELVGRALTDTEFRDLLYSDREAATSGYTLTDVDEQSLDEMTRERLEEHVEVMTHTTSTAVSVGITIKGTFATP